MNDLLTDIPKSWEVQGAPPDASGSPVRLREDLFSVCTPAAAITLDVGWSPVGDPQGGYLCRLVIDDEWEHPTEELRTRSAAAVREWIAAALVTMNELVGQQATHPIPPSSTVEFKPIGEVGMASSSSAQDGIPRAA